VYEGEVYEESKVQHFFPICGLGLPSSLTENIYTYLLRFLLEKLTVSQLIKKFPAFYGN
jgi:hypothetical protein